MKSILLFGIVMVTTLLSMAQTLQKNEVYLLIGTYTKKTSEGVYVLAFNTKTGNSRQLSVAKTSNPSFVTFSNNKKFVYTVNEDDDGKISAFAFDKGVLMPLNKQPAQGAHPCYAAISNNGKFLAVGNYSSGTAAILSINEDGTLGDAVSTVKHEGSSADKSRQQSAHVHGTFFSPDGKYLLVPDLGIDKIMLYNFDEVSGKLTATEQAFVALKPGAGPRHITFTPNGNFVYAIEELSGYITEFAYADGSLTTVQRYNAHEKNFNGKIGSADIHVSPDGKFLYASNRGDANTIAVFAIEADGLLQSRQLIPVKGKAPRNFNFDPTGNFILCANQDTDEVVIFKRNKKTGLLTDTKKRIKISMPVCIRF
jgi:6-phosphogluconolactonase